MWCAMVMTDVALNKVIRKDCTEKVTSESRRKESNHVDIWGKSASQKEGCECKGLEEGMYLAYWDNGKETCVVGVECLWVREVGHKI